MHGNQVTRLVAPARPVASGGYVVRIDGEFGRDTRRITLAR